jgi:hypothetical protein
MGRPFVDSEPVTVRVERKQMIALDDWRRLQEDLPSRPEAIRRLIELGLKKVLEPSAREAGIAASKRANLSDLAEAVENVAKKSRH